ncbi:hypothetical protein O0235_01200 [Tepidiforma flava]|uniref:Histidinol-phosphatase n=1 Tax=Tepidiforma flava TaxID=3004094 RepID=A0ABY7M6V9_9CHLR|nr:inositol monophosphatase family protein [Tepidiforma flava]WBL36249.1 hypothetical protein O0235_01200 [Tepidiforma flava]
MLRVPPRRHRPRRDHARPRYEHRDAAALQPIVREAGGGFSQWDGNPRLGDSAVATNGRLHAEVLRLLAADLEPQP